MEKYPIRLYEMANTSIAEAQIDRDNGIIRRVVVQTKKSKNGKFRNREYSNAAMRKNAEMLNANPRCYINHSLDRDQKKRVVPGVLDLGGRWSNVHFVETDGKNYGDLKILGTSDEKDKIMSRIIEAHDLLGISIVSDGKVVDDYKNKVENVIETNMVASADLVTEPGATTNLFESDNDGVQAEKEKGTKMTLTEFKEAHADLFEQVENSARDGMAKENADLKIKVEELTKKIETLESEKVKVEHQAHVTAKLVEAGIDTKHFKFIETLDESGVDEYIAEWKCTKPNTPAGTMKKNFEQADDNAGGGMAFIDGLYGGK